MFTDWPDFTLPVFVAMMFGRTLGGNANLIGASANVVNAGICAAHRKRLSFGGFARSGVPLTMAQLALSAVYVLTLARILSRWQARRQTFQGSISRGPGLLLDGLRRRSPGEMTERGSGREG